MSFVHSLDMSLRTNLIPARAASTGTCGTTLAEGRARKPENHQNDEPDAAHASLPVDQLPAMHLGRGFDLLAGIRVLDLTGSIAGPYATMLLGDFGADVLKVERPVGGDDTRAWMPPALEGESLWFASVNRNKRSLTLEWGKPEGSRRAAAS